jgi:YHS domain-containing protein
MLRLILIALLLVALFFILRNLVRDLKALKEARTASGGPPDAMVQDPVCRVYVPRETAITTRVGEQTYYFCSQECARVFDRRAAGSNAGNTG